MKQMNLKDYTKKKTDFIDKKLEDFRADVIDKLEELDKGITIDKVLYDLNHNKETAHMQYNLLNTYKVPNSQLSNLKTYDYFEASICMKDILSSLNLQDRDVVVLVLNKNFATAKEYLADGGQWSGLYNGNDFTWNNSKEIEDATLWMNFTIDDEDEWGTYHGYMNWCHDYYKEGCNDIVLHLCANSMATEEFDKFIDGIRDLKLYVLRPNGEIVKEDNYDFSLEYIKETYGFDYKLKLDAANYGFIDFTLGNIGNDLLIDWGDGEISKLGHCAGRIRSTDYHTYKNPNQLYRVKVYTKEDAFDFNEINCDILYYLDASNCTSFCDIYVGNFRADGIGLTNKFTNSSGRSFFEIYNYDFDDCDLSGLVNGDNLFMTGIRKTPQTIDYSKIKEMDYMFQQCVALTDASKVKTDTATTAEGMFLSCYSLESLPQLNLQNCTNIGSFITECYSLESLDLINTNKVTTLVDMCLSCINIKEVKTLDLSSCSTSSFNYGTFYDCHMLQRVTVIGTQAANVIDAFIAVLPTNNLGETRTLDITGCTNKNSVTATAEGWTILK